MLTDGDAAGVRLQRGRHPPAHLPQGAGSDPALSSNRQDVSHNFNQYFANCTSLVYVPVVTRFCATAGGAPATTSTSSPRSAAASAAFRLRPAQRAISARRWVSALLLSPQRRPMPRLLLQPCRSHRNLSLVSRCHTPPRPLLLLQATQTPAPASYLNQNFCLRSHHHHLVPPVPPPLPFSPQLERNWVWSGATAAVMHLQLLLTRCGSRRTSAPTASPACMYAPFSPVWRK